MYCMYKIRQIIQPDQNPKIFQPHVPFCPDRLTGDHCCWCEKEEDKVGG